MVFDPTIPHNSLLELPNSFDFDQKKLLKEAVKANQALAKLNGLARLLPNKELLIAPLLTKESVESNAIENINTTTVKVLQSEAVTGGKVVSGPEKEVLHYRKAILYGKEKMDTYGGLPYVLLHEIQAMIEKEKPGLRTIPGTIIAGKDGKAVYTPPEGIDNIKRLLENLEEFMHAFGDEIDPLIKVAVVHFQFESIHPYYDGNGRTGRILMLLYLMLTKKIDYPILFLSEYINAQRTTYYNLLNETNRTDDYTKFILFILEGIRKQSVITEKKIENICGIMKDVESTLQNQTNLDYHKITKILFSYPYITVGKFMKELEVSKPTISKYVKILQSLEVIETVKIGRTILIYVPQFIQLLT